MNIVVKPYGSSLCYCRPDTTWEKEGRDLYIPDGVEKVLLAPVVFARVSKAGKCISSKFVTRYYDAAGFGALIYSDEESIAFSSCMDHTSLLPMPLYNTAVFENEENIFRLTAEDKHMEYHSNSEVMAVLEDAICKASERVSLRIGDLVAVELAPMEVSAERKDGETSLKAEFCENSLFDLKVIF
jgi:hypothetical protein